MDWYPCHSSTYPLHQPQNPSVYTTNQNSKMHVFSLNFLLVKTTGSMHCISKIFPNFPHPCLFPHPTPIGSLPHLYPEIIPISPLKHDQGVLSWPVMHDTYSLDHVNVCCLSVVFVPCMHSLAVEEPRLRYTEFRPEIHFFFFHRYL